MDIKEIKSFMEYMMFFEYGKYLKDHDIVKRGLRAPKIKDDGSTRNRVSSVMLKGLRSECCDSLEKTEIINGGSFQCKKIERVRGRGLSATNEYFKFYFHYAIECFISSEYYPSSSRVFEDCDKIGLLKLLCGDDEDENIEIIMENYEFMFSNYIDWYTVYQKIQILFGRVFSNDNPIVEEYDLEAEISQRDTIIKNYHAYSYLHTTIHSLCSKYLFGENTAIVEPLRNDENNSFLLNSTLIDYIIKNKKNHILLDNINHGDGYSFLHLVKRKVNEDGHYVSPNLINIESRVKLKIKDDILRNPEVFFSNIKSDNRRLREEFLNE